jgi:hypothetical protein
MANLQKEFLEFHDLIKLKIDDENAKLKEKRDIILDRLSSKISSDAKSYTHFNQGSYAMATGIKPIAGEYDIDVGLWFDMSKDDVKPMVAKKWVYDALIDHTDEVCYKNPCITVTYKENGEPKFHVDVTVYAVSNTDGKVYLAKGKPGSKDENKKWEESNPKDLIKLISEHFDDADDRKQFRRVIRYLKRWKDHKFTAGSAGKPTGIALTICAYHHFTSSYNYDFFEQKKKYDDLAALEKFISVLRGKFSPKYSFDNNGNLVVDYRMEILLPVSPYTDLFVKMTDNQMTNVYDKLGSLQNALKEAKSEVDPVKAAELLEKQFGDDFPIPPKPATGKTQSRVISTHSDSA